MAYAPRTSFPHLLLASRLEDVHTLWQRRLLTLSRTTYLATIEATEREVLDYRENGHGVPLPTPGRPFPKHITIGRLERYAAVLEAQLAKGREVIDAQERRIGILREERAGYQGEGEMPAALKGLFDDDEEPEPDSARSARSMCRSKSEHKPDIDVLEDFRSEYASSRATRHSFSQSSRPERKPDIDEILNTDYGSSCATRGSSNWPSTSVRTNNPVEGVSDAGYESDSTSAYYTTVTWVEDKPEVEPDIKPDIKPDVYHVTKPDMRHDQQLDVKPSSQRPFLPQSEAALSRSPSPIPELSLVEYTAQTEEVEVATTQLKTVRYAIRILRAWYGIEACVAACEAMLESLQPQDDSDEEMGSDEASEVDVESRYDRYRSLLYRF